MKTVLRAMGRLLILSAMMLGSHAFAQELAGTWQGKLAVDPNESLLIQFTFTKKPDGTYSAVLNAPSSAAIKNVAASTVAWNAGTLKVEVPSLSGSYSGTLKNGAFDGKWTQQGTALPLALARPAQLSKAESDAITGAWSGPMTVPNVGRTLTMVYQLKTDDKNGLTGTLTVPEQGAQDIPMQELEFASNRLAFKIPQARAEFSGTVANGALTGIWKQPGLPPEGLPVTLKKGEYKAPSYVLNLNTAAYAALNGKWEGKLSPPNAPAPLNVVLRFHMNERGQIVGFIDSPAQKAMNIPVSEATYDKGKLVAKLAIGAEFRADLANKTLTGNWKQGPLDLPLTLTRTGDP